MPADYLKALEAIFPEKTGRLATVFRNTTTSYKLVWFLAIMNILERKCEPAIRLHDIFREMIAVVWHPVCLYRLFLGKLDRLQNAAGEISRVTGLSAVSDIYSVRNCIHSFPTVSKKLSFIAAYVPTRFLSPWFAKQLRGRKDHEKDGLIRRLAAESQQYSISSPYYFTAQTTEITFNKSWLSFIYENLGVIRAFAEYNFAQYLQSRNPNVPGIINKLHAPTKRNLSPARKFWRYVRKEFAKRGLLHMFYDIFTQQPLGDRFAIDHFLPWSFVVHDMKWNLVPVERSTNSKKSDAIPDLSIYLPRLVRLHQKAIEVSLDRPRLLEDYALIFKEEPRKLFSMSAHELERRYRAIFAPQAQIAANQGFRSDWLYQ